MKIGLLGGSFDPPHEAHRAVSLFAMKRLGLDRVWWLVTPGNPLKDTRRLPSLLQRLEAARRFAAHPRIDVTNLEAAIGTRFTCDTIAWLTDRFPSVRLVWIMGADNLAQFDRWRNWRAIAARVPIAVVDRFGASLAATGAVAAQALATARIPEGAARSLPYRRPPAWVYLHGIKSPLSSTAIRATE
ncbi:MAG TPA: nicotinate-nucleotide adenylyltransferase [Xanthobacteraceae bacterium]|jgi:nicotinate-nucleotide adenylyltransferase|nr:nicotinate-nucleotide adenylyltransferase [Xanthobacteraceae bacterium]